MTGVIVEKIESIMLCGCNEVNLTFLSSLSILAHCALLERAEKGFSFFVILRRSLDFLMSSCCTDVKETGYLTVLLLCVHPPGQKFFISYSLFGLSYHTNCQTREPFPNNMNQFAKLESQNQ